MKLKRKIFTEVKGKLGFTCSAFDLLHAGHCIMLEDAKRQCDFLVVGLHTDPTLDRAEKNKPVQSVKERYIQLAAIKYVDAIVKYNTEAELHQLLVDLAPDVRIIGSDWQGKDFTGHELPIAIYYHLRSHDFSTSELRQRIYAAEKPKNG